MLYFGVSIIFAVLISLGAMWYQVPVNKAKTKRMLMKKNWVLVTIRHGGGQLRSHVVCAEPKKKGDEGSPTFTVNAREYVPIEKVTRKELVTNPTTGMQMEREITDSIVNFIDSVPVYFYNYDDSKPVALSGVDVEQKFRNPALLNSIFMQVQALYRTKVAKEIAQLMKTVSSWDMRIWIIIAVCAITCLVSLYNLVQLQQVQSMVINSHNILNQSFTSALQNQLPG